MKAHCLRTIRHPLFQILFKYGLGFALLGTVIWFYWDQREDGEQVGLSAALERPVHWPALFGALAICLASVLATIVRWYYLVRVQNLPFALRDAFRLGLVGFFFNSCLPGSVGGDLIKAAFLAREQSRRTVAIATVLLDRVIGLAGLYWLAALLGGALFLSGAFDPLLADASARWTLQTILLGACAIAGGSLVFWLLLGWLPKAWLDAFQERMRRLPKVGPSVAELVQAVRIYRQQGRAVGLALGISIVSHFGFVFTFYYAANFFTPAERLPPLGAHLLLVPVGATIQAGIPLPGGIGGAEFGYGALYRLSGFRFVDGVLGSLGLRMVLWILGLGGYFVYLRMRPAAHLSHPGAEPTPAAHREAVLGSVVDGSSGNG